MTITNVCSYVKALPRDLWKIFRPALRRRTIGTGGERITSGVMPQRAIQDGLFRLEGGDLVLVGGYSPSSGRYHFPVAPVCPYTGADDVEEVALSSTGTLWSWTAVSAPPPGYEGEVPYGLGVVELDGGLRVVGRLTESDPGSLENGQPMRVVADAVFVDDEGADVITWAFAPQDGGDG